MSKDNITILHDLMNHAKCGRIMQAFVMNALEVMADKVLSAEQLNTAPINPEAWKACAQEISEMISERRQCPEKQEPEGDTVKEKWQSSNKNCLEGMCCPNPACRNEGPFTIRAEANFTVTDDGTDEYDSVDWYEDSTCICIECGHAAEVKEFRRRSSR